MPKKLDATPAPSRSKYRFAEYADGGWWEFRQGVDYQTATDSFGGAARAWAARNGYTLERRSREKQTIVALRFTPKEPR